MKRPWLTAGIFLALSGALAALKAATPKEPVTLDLRDARLTDVISTLGALANLPVVIEPGIEGKVTLRLEKVPFDKILELLSRENGISVRIEDGKLIASRSREAPIAAPALPERFRDAPRILLTEYAPAAASPPPLLITAARNGEVTCSIARIGSGGGGLLEVPLSKSGAPDALVVADMGYDPVWKSRTIALESVDGSFRNAFLLAVHGAPVSVYKTRDGQSVRLSVSQSPKLIARFVQRGDCADLVFQPSGGGAPVTVSVQASAISEGGTPSPVFSPRIHSTAGSVFKALGSETDSGVGVLRGYALTGYVSRDGKKVALAFKARAVWTDPEDGRQYYFTQTGIPPVQFFPLSKSGFVLPAAVQPGVATPYALELRVFGEE